MKDFSFVAKAYHELLSDGKYMDQQLILIAVIVVIVWIGTIAVLAEQAELKGKRPGLVIIAGLIVPILGAVAMFFIAQSKNKPAEKEEADEVSAVKEPETEKVVEEEYIGSYRKEPKDRGYKPVNQEEAVEEAAEEPEEEKVVIDQAYFESLKNKYGKDKAYVIFAGEQQYNVVELIEAMPALVVAMVRDEYEKEHRMRIPYSKITDVKY